jgi:hypothetical protein
VPDAAFYGVWRTSPVQRATGGGWEARPLSPREGNRRTRGTFPAGGAAGPPTPTEGVPRAQGGTGRTGPGRAAHIPRTRTPRPREREGTVPILTLLLMGGEVTLTQDSPMFPPEGPLPRSPS